MKNVNIGLEIKTEPGKDEASRVKKIFMALPSRYRVLCMKSAYGLNCRKLLQTSIIRKNDASSSHYDTLGLHKSAKKKEIREAYLNKTKEYHPDKNPNDKSSHEKFVAVTQAYEVLGDEQLRNIYDGVSHPNVVYQQRTQRNSTSSANPFGDYQYSGREWQWDPETKKKAYEEFYKTCEEQHETLRKHQEERLTKNRMVLSFLLVLIVVVTIFNFSRILLIHGGVRRHMDRTTAENAAFLTDGRTGYKSFIAKVASNKSKENDSP